MIRILHSTVGRYSKSDAEGYALQKTEKYLLDVFQRNSLATVLGTRLTDRISNSTLYEKCY